MIPGSWGFFDFEQTIAFHVIADDGVLSPISRKHQNALMSFPGHLLVEKSPR